MEESPHLKNAGDKEPQGASESESAALLCGLDSSMKEEEEAAAILLSGSPPKGISAKTAGDQPDEQPLSPAESAWKILQPAVIAILESRKKPLRSLDIIHALTHEYPHLQTYTTNFSNILSEAWDLGITGLIGRSRRNKSGANWTYFIKSEESVAELGDQKDPLPEAQGAAAITTPAEKKRSKPSPGKIKIETQSGGEEDSESSGDRSSMTLSDSASMATDGEEEEEDDDESKKSTEAQRKRKKEIEMGVLRIFEKRPGQKLSAAEIRTALESEEKIDGIYQQQLRVILREPWFGSEMGPVGYHGKSVLLYWLLDSETELQEGGGEKMGGEKRTRKVSGGSSSAPSVPPSRKRSRSSTTSIGEGATGAPLAPQQHQTPAKRKYTPRSRRGKQPAEDFSLKFWVAKASPPDGQPPEFRAITLMGSEDKNTLAEAIREVLRLPADQYFRLSVEGDPDSGFVPITMSLVGGRFFVHLETR